MDSTGDRNRTSGEPRIAGQAGVLAHVSARLRSRQLDRALAGGTSPETTASLALRARRLTALPRRRAIACSLRRVIRDTCSWAPRSRAQISPRRSQVIAASDELTRLADTLESPGPVAARGVALAWILLTDGTGPLYYTNSAANLRARAAHAVTSLRLED